MPWALGPADGRYVLRGHAGEPSHVLVIQTLGAPVARGRGPLRRRRRPRDVAPGPPPAEALATRATLVGARALEEPGEAWLARIDAEAEAEAAIAELNRVLHAQRLAATDPSVRPLRRAQATAVRVGVGIGEQVADGRWNRAVEVPPPRAGTRGAALRPSERLAALLGSRDVALACEDLTLRAREDADAGRWREAAFQLRVALEAALAELAPWSGQADLDARIEELRALRPQVGAAANAALEGGLPEPQIAEVAAALARLEAALRARAQVELGRPAG